MVAGIDVLLFRPDAELRRLARAGARDRGRRRVRRGPHAGGDRRRARAHREAGRAWLRRARGDQGPVVQHGHRRRADPLLPQLAGRSEHPLRRADRPRRGAARRRAGRAADRGDRARARPARRGLRARCCPTRPAARWQRPAGALAHRVPLRRGAQVLLRLLVPHALVEQDPRVRRAARPPRLPRGRRGRLPALAPRGRHGARRAGADLGDRRPGARTDALAADRRAAQGAAGAARPTGRRRRRSASRPRRSPTR